MKRLVRITDGDRYVIAEQRGDVLTHRLATCGASDDDAELAQRLCLAYNASAGLSMARLSSLSTPTVTVPLDDALAVLDIIVRTDPTLIHRILSKVREDRHGT